MVGGDAPLHFPTFFGDRNVGRVGIQKMDGFIRPSISRRLKSSVGSCLYVSPSGCFNRSSLKAYGLFCSSFHTSSMSQMRRQNLANRRFFFVQFACLIDNWKQAALLGWPEPWRNE